MHSKTVLLALFGAIAGCPSAETATDPRGETLVSTADAAGAAEYKGIRQSSDAAKPDERVPPRMKFIPGGTFETGLDEDDVQALELDNPAIIKLFAASVPRHEVTVEPYYIGEFETTNAQWKIYLDATEQKPSKDLVDNLWIDGEIPKGYENRPVTYVSIPEVEAYCRWAMLRLPTEHEWTFAARGPDGALYPWGNEFDEPVPDELRRRPRDAQEAEALEKARDALRQGGNMAWCADSTQFKGRREPQAVGTMPAGASPFGLQDVVGNVWEWTASPYTAFPGYDDIEIKTTTSRGRKEKYSAGEYFSTNRRVIKGGAFDSPSLALRTDVRQFETEKAWNNTVGFRVAKSVRPGVDAIQYALGDVGSYEFHPSNTPLKLSATQAVELTHFDADGRVTGHQGIVFAPVSDWVKMGKTKDAAHESLKKPLSIGLLHTSEPVVYPPLPPGTYMIAYQAADKKWKEPPEFKETPSRDWTFHGWEEFDTALKVKDPKGSKDDEPAEGEGAEGEGTEGAEGEAEPTEEELDLEKYRYRASEGSVPYNEDRENLLVLDQQSRVLAVLPIEELKESSKGVETALERATIGEDRKKRLPKTERYLYSWSVALKGARKHVKFELPLRFSPDAFRTEPARAKVGTEAAGDER